MKENDFQVTWKFKYGNDWLGTSWLEINRGDLNQTRFQISILYIKLAFQANGIQHIGLDLMFFDIFALNIGAEVLI